MIKKLITTLALVFALAFTFAASIAHGQSKGGNNKSTAPKTVTDCFLKIPAKYLPVFERIKNRRSLIETEDIANGYLRLGGDDWEGWGENFQLIIKKFITRFQRGFMKTLSRIILLCAALSIGNASVFAQTKNRKAEVKFGFAEDFKRAGNGFEIELDYAEMFDGDEAVREAKRDGEPSPGETSGVYIRNRNPKIRVEKIAANAIVIALKDLQPFRLTLAQFERLRNGELKDAEKFWGFPDRYGAGGEPMPCRVTLKNGAVTKIERVYFP